MFVNVDRDRGQDGCVGVKRDRQREEIWSLGLIVSVEKLNDVIGNKFAVDVPGKRSW